VSDIVIFDCTVSASWYLPDEGSDFSQKLLADVIARRLSLVVPDLWWYENMNVLKSAVRRKRISEQEAHKALFLLKEIPLDTVEPGKQGQFGVLSLALADNLSAYDATYLHLALSSGAVLYTSDSDLLNLRKKYTCIKATV
jgi:predicted nucleic acid-binding protein